MRLPIQLLAPRFRGATACLCRILVVALLSRASARPAEAATLGITLRSIVERGNRVPWILEAGRFSGDIRAAGRLGDDVFAVGDEGSSETVLKVWVERRTRQGELVWHRSREMPRPGNGIPGVDNSIGDTVALTPGPFVHFTAAGQLFTYRGNGEAIPPTGVRASRVFFDGNQLHAVSWGECASGMGHTLVSPDGSKAGAVVGITADAGCARPVGVIGNGNLLSLGGGWSDGQVDAGIEGRSLNAELRTVVRVPWVGAAPWQVAVPTFVQLDSSDFVLAGRISDVFRTETTVGYGGDDVWMGWATSAGRKRLDRAFGGKGTDRPFSIHGIGDSQVVLVATTTGSGISGTKRVDGDGTWVLQLDASGGVEAEILLRDVYPLAVLPSADNVLLLVRDDHSVWLDELRIVRRFVLTAEAGAGEAVSVESSTDLRTWKTIASGLAGRLTVEEVAGGARRFFRIAP